MYYHPHFQEEKPNPHRLQATQSYRVSLAANTLAPMLTKIYPGMTTYSKHQPKPAGFLRRNLRGCPQDVKAQAYNHIGATSARVRFDSLGSVHAPTDLRTGTGTTTSRQICHR
jgi:hypothetical protein